MYAVAGVTGHTGAAVADALLGAGQGVRVIVRREQAGAAWKARGAEVVVADLADATALTAALRGTQGAYLLNPPRYDVADPLGAAQKVGVSLARAIPESGVPRAVVLSSVGAHHRSGTGIIDTLHRLETALASVKTPIAFVRASYFFENWGPVLGAVRAQDVLPTFFKSANYPMPMQTVRDIAAAVVSILVGAPWQGHRTIELSSFEASAADVAEAFSDILGKPVAPAVVPREQWTGILAASGFSPAVVEQFVAMYDGINSGVVAAEAGNENRRGTTTLKEAARALLG
jgi:uncharacterized protein YbjT (DUF2867 family)